jgi:hypothetical protein
MELKIMPTKIEHIQRRLHRFGWSARDKKIITLSGNRLWLIFGKWRNQSFTVQGRTQTEAWESAWQLTRQIQSSYLDSPEILPFPRNYALYNRAG